LTRSRSRNSAEGGLQEGQDLDFKREVNIDKPEAKSRLLDDVVAFLNRGAARIIVGVEERAAASTASGRSRAIRTRPRCGCRLSFRMASRPFPSMCRSCPCTSRLFILDIQIPPRRPRLPSRNITVFYDCRYQ
jgi:hypothetical protein